MKPIYSHHIVKPVRQLHEPIEMFAYEGRIRSNPQKHPTYEGTGVMLSLTPLSGEYHDAFSVEVDMANDPLILLHNSANKIWPVISPFEFQGGKKRGVEAKFKLQYQLENVPTGYVYLCDSKFEGISYLVSAHPLENNIPVETVLVKKLNKENIFKPFMQLSQQELLLMEKQENSQITKQQLLEGGIEVRVVHAFWGDRDQEYRTPALGGHLKEEDFNGHYRFKMHAWGRPIVEAGGNGRIINIQKPHHNGGCPVSACDVYFVKPSDGEVERLKKLIAVLPESQNLKSLREIILEETNSKSLNAKENEFH